MKAFQAAIEADPKHADAHCKLGWLRQFQLKDYDGAIKAYQAAVETDPKRADAHCKIGDLRDNLGDYDVGPAEGKGLGGLLRSHKSDLNDEGHSAI